MSGPIRHGHAMRKKASPEYIAWMNMKIRCLNPKYSGYHIYGRRGITICDAWIKSFEAFFAEVGERPSSKHSLDRINNELGYRPGNVRWATRSEQGRNQRTNHLLTINGETRCQAEWAGMAGISQAALQLRIARGWTGERLILSSRASHPPVPRLVMFNGETRRLSEWGKIVNIAATTLKQRLLSGWSVERTLTTPVRGRGPL